MNQAKLVAGVLVGTMLILVVVGMLMGRFTGETSGAVDTAVLLDGARQATGSGEAKVTMVEWSDFQCPGCRQAEVIVKEILNQYGDQVRLVYRHFPLTAIHKNAMAAAELTEAAATAGKFWQMHDLLFERQNEWANDKDKLNEYRLKLGINEGGSYKEFIEKDMEIGQSIGVNATPTFFVNGKRTTTAQLGSLVEAELKK